MKLDALKFALAAGIWLGGCVALSTIATIVGVPGFKEFTSGLVAVYSAYGYSISWVGVLVGAFWGFVEGFIHLGIFALIYNKFVK